MVHSAASPRRPRWALSQRSVDTSSEAHIAAAGSRPDAQSGLVSDGSTRGRAPQTACARKAPTPRLSTSDGDSFWTASQVINRNRTAASLLIKHNPGSLWRARYLPTDQYSQRLHTVLHSTQAQSFVDRVTSVVLWSPPRTSHPLGPRVTVL